MLKFEKSLREEGMLSNGYCYAIKKLFTEARLHYNDNAEGKTVITRSLDLFIPQKDLKQADRRVLTAEQVRKVKELGDITVNMQRRRDIGRDVFLMSFLTMGTTTIDLYECELDAEGNITYERAKVRDRRSDRARIVIRPHSVLKPLMEKYANPDYPTDRHAFCFYKRYADAETFGGVVNKGLKEVGTAIGVEGLNFYAARHSMATIATNDLGINKYVVHEMLNHRIPLFRVTSMYIRQSFDEINNANFKLLDYVFGGREEEGTRNTFIDSDGEFGSSVFIDSLEELDDEPITFNYMVIPQDMLPYETWRVVIRMSYQGEDIEIPTSVIVGKDDLNRDFEIIDGCTIDRCEALVDTCKEKVRDIDFDCISCIQDILALLRS